MLSLKKPSRKNCRSIHIFKNINEELIYFNVNIILMGIELLQYANFIIQFSATLV